MSDSFTLPADYKYVVAALPLIPIVNIVLDYTVMRARRAARVPLPQLFASAEEAAKDPRKHQFNCTQKSSLNFAEHVGPVIAAILAAGTYMPKTAAVGTVVFATGRLLYHFGYATGEPQKRMRGAVGSFAYAAMVIIGLGGSVLTISKEILG